MESIMSLIKKAAEQKMRQAEDEDILIAAARKRGKQRLIVNGSNLAVALMIGRLIKYSLSQGYPEDMLIAAINAALTKERST
jgi:uncharacterized membrane protein (DUF441 family)